MRGGLGGTQPRGARDGLGGEEWRGRGGVGRGGAVVWSLLYRGVGHTPAALRPPAACRRSGRHWGKGYILHAAIKAQNKQQQDKKTWNTAAVLKM